MLTQGYRRFVWSNLKKVTGTSPLFKAEGLATYVSGKVVTLGNKPVPNAVVTMISIRGNIVKGTTTDKGGRFKFDGIFIADSLKFSIQASSQKKGSKVEVILDTVPKIAARKHKNISALNTDFYTSTMSYAKNVRRHDELMERSGGMSSVKRLKQVNIVAKAYQKNLPKQRNYNLNGSGNYDQIITNQDLQTCASLMSCLEGRLTGIIFKEGLPFSTRASPGINGGGGMNGVMLIVLDGIPLSQSQNASTIEDIFLNNNPTPDQIASVEVLRSVNYTNKYGPDALNGVILITTKNGGNHAAAYNPSVVNFSPKSFDKARLFYAPKYESLASKVGFPDVRSTIYWNPGLKTDLNGKAILNFFTADGPATYKVTVEGIDADGKLGRTVYRFSVVAKN